MSKPRFFTKILPIVTDTDLSTKEKLNALVTQLDKSSSIFKPQTT